MKKALLIFGIIGLFTWGVKAQDTTKFSVKDSNRLYRPFQLSYFYPLGSNGLDAYKYENLVSINILAGMSGGVKAAEFAGIGNVTLGNVRGVQTAGLFNMNVGHVRGAQGSGFVNVVTGDFKGGQGAGFVNVVHGDFVGAQGSGFINYNSKSFKGFQGAGFANVSLEDVKGVQWSGFMNASLTNLKGMQASGFLNVVKDTLQGSQWSGFANYAKHVKGFQIGVFNYADTISKGIPIGFLSFVRKGYHKGEIEFSPSMIAAANFKTGVKRFYNILSVGVAKQNDKFLYGMGYGIGSMVSLNDKLDLNVDLVSTQLLDDTQIEKINLMNKFKVNVAYKLTNFLHLYGGPTVDVLVHHKDVTSVLDSPTYSWANGNNTTLTKVQFGFSGGLRF